MKQDVPLEQFDEWNQKKKNLQQSDRHIYFKQGDVWWTSVGQNIGSESFGKGPMFRRPVLVIKKLASDFCIVVPLSSKQKQGTWFHTITLHGEKNTALLYQVRACSSKRFQRKIGELDEHDFTTVIDRLGKLIGL